MIIEFGRQVCGSLDEAASREWLVTDGLGGYAMGTVAGLRTRRYHGLLMVAGAAANGSGEAGVSRRMRWRALWEPPGVPVSSFTHAPSSSSKAKGVVAKPRPVTPATAPSSRSTTSTSWESSAARS